MIITWLGVVVALLAALALPEETQARLSGPLPRELSLGLALTVGLMIAHKAESWVQGEYDRCPVYLNIGKAPWGDNPRQTFFVGFVGTLLAMLVLVALILWGGPWPMLLLLIWIFHSQHELHHLGKSIVERRYYPGTVSGLAFTAGVDLLMLPGWVEAAGLPELAVPVWVALHLPMLGAYALEHRGWLAKGGAACVGLA
ncbi:MAG: HXXEE domain-containing protein [Alphaproteobacteria bacterium]|nr:HXXEE domain-containing protein [Alphaproteobacteria bacterium]MCB9791483.1 HXXEE domain-containing protein [Alphaproteobacteria bacterium]